MSSWEECSFTELPRGVGATPVRHGMHWYALAGRTPMRWTGAGAVDLQNPNSRPVIDAANTLIDWFQSNACTQASIPAVSQFQTAYNASGLPGTLTVDGQYGGNSQAALQNVMNQAAADAGAGPAQQAPTNCFGMAVPATPALDPTPATPSGPQTLPTIVVTGNPPTDYTPWIIGAAVAGGAGLVGYAAWKRHKRRAR